MAVTRSKSRKRSKSRAKSIRRSRSKSNGWKTFVGSRKKIVPFPSNLQPFTSLQPVKEYLLSNGGYRKKGISNWSQKGLLRDLNKKSKYHKPISRGKHMGKYPLDRGDSFALKFQPSSGKYKGKVLEGWV